MDMEVHTCNPSTEPLEMGWALELAGQPASYTMSSRLMRSPALKNMVDGFQGKTVRVTSGYVCVHTFVFASIHR